LSVIYVETDDPIDVDVLKDKAMEFGKAVLNHFMATSIASAVNPVLVRTQRSAAEGRTSRQLENEHEGLERKPRVSDWLARLIGVDGKTLGEFLREYQVHVLYDLVFTFFKWIFFLYAGLLIP